jgi:hypothetical protein
MLVLQLCMGQCSEHRARLYIFVGHKLSKACSLACLSMLYPHHTPCYDCLLLYTASALHLLFHHPAPHH